MGPMVERLAEYAITEWHGARIRVTIEVPQMQNSMSTQMVISALDLEDLKYLTMPQELKMMLENDHPLAQYKLMQYEQKRKMAQNIVDQIAGTIANQITRAIGKENF